MSTLADIVQAGMERIDAAWVEIDRRYVEDEHTPYTLKPVLQVEAEDALINALRVYRYQNGSGPVDICNCGHLKRCDT